MWSKPREVFFTDQRTYEDKIGAWKKSADWEFRVLHLGSVDYNDIPAGACVHSGDLRTHFKAA